MKLNNLILITEAIEQLSLVTDVTESDIIDVLTGICWDEEESSEVRSSMGLYPRHLED